MTFTITFIAYDKREYVYQWNKVFEKGVQGNVLGKRVLSAFHHAQNTLDNPLNDEIVVEIRKDDES